MYGRISDSGMSPYPPRVALALRTPGWGFHICGAVSARGTAVFVSGSSELQIYGRVSDLGMWPYPFRLQRDLDVPPRVNSRRSLRAP